MRDTTGRRIAWLRALRGWTQTELAERLGIDRAHISQLERDRTLPSARVLIGLATSLETSTDFLLGLTDDPGVGERYPFAASEDERWARIEALIERLEEVTERLERVASSRVSASASSKVIDPVPLAARLLSLLTPEERDLLLRAAGVITETGEEPKAASGE